MPVLPPGSLGPGDRLGPYRIVRPLGVGGMGAVYEALDEGLDRPVAIKVISPGLAQDPVFRDRFTREAQVQASLDSPHVVQVFAYGEIDGRLYIATQFVPDGDLGQMIRRHGAPPPRVAVDVIAQVAAGLAEAHRVGLLHRDIKPANVLVRNRGEEVSAYLADFGIARRVDAPEGLTTEGFAVGTPSYMAPELHTGGRAGPASDIYALGCLLWAALTGSAPYAGTTDYQVVNAHVSAPVPQLAERGPFEREVNRILRSAMAKDPAARYPRASQLRDDLRALERLGGVPAVIAQNGPTAPSPQRTAFLTVPPASGVPTRRRRIWPAVAIAVAAIVLVTGVVVGAVAFATHGGGGDGPGPTDPSASTGSASRDQQAIDNITHSLETDGHLDPGTARCTAEKLVAKEGVDGLQQKGLLDDDLQLTRGDDGHVDPTVLAEVFTSTFSCAFSSATADPG